ncbi:MAG: UMP kinase [Rhodobiaceae bacterium]|nr:UMP kinase [Rhodobiaceae bacterium]MCC0057496.1 UMP kinase [Rhodobiaceae bacterium]
MTGPTYKRVLIKVSGEALMGTAAYGLDMPTVGAIAAEIVAVRKAGIDVAIVVGAGNIFRGLSEAAKGLDRAEADYLGMMATVMNGVALSAAITEKGCDSVVLSGLEVPQVCESYTLRGARAHMAAGRVVVFAGGTGNPFFTTDTASALRAAEMGCDALLKATQVDGVYSADPKKVPDARRYDALSFSQVLGDNLAVMDGAAIALCRDNGIPIIVCSIAERGGLANVLSGGGKATIISGD